MNENSGAKLDTEIRNKADLKKALREEWERIGPEYKKKKKKNKKQKTKNKVVQSTPGYLNGHYKQRITNTVGYERLIFIYN